MDKVIVTNGQVLHNGRFYVVGDTVPDLTEEQAIDLCAAGVAERLHEVTEDAPVVEDEEQEELTKPLEEMTKAELFEIAKDMGLDLDERMKKADIIAAIEEEETETDEMPVTEMPM